MSEFENQKESQDDPESNAPPPTPEPENPQANRFDGFSEEELQNLQANKQQSDQNSDDDSK